MHAFLRVIIAVHAFVPCGETKLRVVTYRFRHKTYFQNSICWKQHVWYSLKSKVPKTRKLCTSVFLATNNFLRLNGLR